MTNTAAVVVIGLGAAGAATLMQLARRGVACIGIDRFSPPHQRGSSHGDTRITRLATGEGDEYVPLVQRSHELWREIEAEADATLLHQIGALIVESAGSDHSLHGERNFLQRTLAIAKRHGIVHAVLDGEQLGARFPQFRFEGGETGYFEPAAGYLRLEACVAAQLKLAERYGAVIRRDEPVVDVVADAAGVRVRTDRGGYTAERVVLSLGPWLPDFVPAPVRGLFTVYRQTLVWYALRAGARDHSPEVMPVYIWGLAGGVFFYGFPAVDGPRGGIKIATEQFEAPTTADRAAIDVSAAETGALFRIVADPMPGVSDRVVKAVRCLYTMTADHGFVIDRHPDSDRLLIVSACSGHGFKHSAALGEAAAELITTGASRLDLSAFTLARLIPTRA